MKLQMAVSHCVGAESQTRILWESSIHSLLLSGLSSPIASDVNMKDPISYRTGTIATSFFLVTYLLL